MLWLNICGLFGPWAIVISFFTGCVHQCGQYFFLQFFLSTANGLIFGLPLGILISWLAETVGVVISFLLMRYYSEVLLKRSLLQVTA